MEDLHKKSRRPEARDDENSRLRDQFSVLFTEWIRVFHHPGFNEKSHTAFVSQLQILGILKSDDLCYLFFRVCTEISVDMFIKSKASPGGHLQAFQAVDSLGRLIVLVIRDFEGVNGRQDNATTGATLNTMRVNLITKILSIIVLVLVHTHETRKQNFNQRPFFRLFSTLLNDIHSFEQHLQPLSFQIISSISNTFHTLQPQFLPGFSFSWLQLISHRHFMMKLLSDKQKGWSLFQRLLVDLFKFLAPSLKQIESQMSEAFRQLYKGTLRVLAIILHDFPEFLCDYHFSFVDVIPLSCTQLRNIILSAYPRNMRLPDPVTPNLKLDMLPESKQHPPILMDFSASLIPNNLKQDLDTYVKTRYPVNFLFEMKSKLLRSDFVDGATPDGGSKYNIQVINALVLYVGVHAIAQTSNKQFQGLPPITHSAPMDIFQQLVMDLDNEGRYLFFNAIVNQLRYPNYHTLYFSAVLLYLFAEAHQEVVQEQITRVLLERLIGTKPHPYGVSVTFLELVRNPQYRFWDHKNFIRCAPEIEGMFVSVSQSLHLGA